MGGTCSQHTGAYEANEQRSITDIEEQDNIQARACTVSPKATSLMPAAARTLLHLAPDHMVHHRQPATCVEAGHAGADAGRSRSYAARAGTLQPSTPTDMHTTAKHQLPATVLPSIYCGIHA